MIDKSNSQFPLFVDLDGTLIKTDLMFEGIFLLLRQNPLLLFAIPLWWLGGRARLKSELAKRTKIDAELLPVNPEFLEYLQQEKARGRLLILISASDQRAVDGMAARFPWFDQYIGSDGVINLKSKAKLARIQQLNEGRPFAYAGNSSADLAVWAGADEVIRVNCSTRLGAGLLKDKQERLFDARTDGSLLRGLWASLRPRHWLKNGLLFIPLILAHRVTDLHLLEHLFWAIVSFSLAASSAYLLNDLLDLEADRRHSSKRHRPLASGGLPVQVGLAMVAVLWVMAVVLAHLASLDFIAVLGFYWLLAVLYSLLFKRMFGLDVVALAVLNTLRLVAGAAAVFMQPSNLLLAFSLSLFLGLAMARRVAALTAVDGSDTEQPSQPLSQPSSQPLSPSLSQPQSPSRSQPTSQPISQPTSNPLTGLAYTSKHLWLLKILGIIASAGATLTVGLSIIADQTAALYSSPYATWILLAGGFLLCLILNRIWNVARDGRLQDDPVLFVITDRLCQIAIALMLLTLWLAI